ncbi:Isotrichodermin C-15 hydroxylase [Chaetomidium leptoderma]|uniref:Isotrichodermin C-15 hydroxylase n=1 Tax=Chaetomidium leptoderma TaxID=669021 RepID=A0AAN6ZUL3_9PEZI|nr:Isotrichodermin C-15 hydroxylase [Chaetomidium leptoderma]
MFLDAIFQRLLSVPTLATVILAAIALNILTTAIYNLFLHPLASHPGPLLSRALPFAHALRILSGHGPTDVHALHETYGPVVRLGPNHLSYTDVRAWRDIFGHRAGADTSENPKSRLFYRQSLVRRDGNPVSILDADREEHGRLRRAVAGGFSERAMTAQEPVIQGYVDLLMRRLREQSGRGKAVVDMVQWYNWTTFDVVGDLVFAESFGCLEEQRGHTFVDTITNLVEQQAMFLALKYSGLASIGLVKWTVNKLLNFMAADLLKTLHQVMGAKLQHRLDLKEERTDLFEGLMSKREEWNLGMDRLQANAVLMAAAGSETTASLLSGATYFLLTNPDVMDKLKDEVRSSFNSVSDITIASVGRLPYLLAFLNEALRRYPPAVSNLPREVCEGGAIIAGQYIPEKTIVEIQHYAMNHSSQHWEEPFAFRPDRWLNKVDGAIGEVRESGEEEKDPDGDRLEAMQVFSMGPRNCVGRNLAYAEMRLIIARVIFEFDLKFAEGGKEWLHNPEVYTIWKKKPLNVHLTPVN